MTPTCPCCKSGDTFTVQTGDRTWQICSTCACQWNESRRAPDARTEVDAARIARAIFECGDEPHSKTWRIQFMCGNKWNERGGGGLDEDALTRLIASVLRDRQP